MAYNLATAAAATGKTKSTILKSIQKGRITAAKDDFGNWHIDPAEVHRVYPPVSKELNNEHEETKIETEETSKIRELEARLEAMGELLNEIKRSREKTEAQLEKEREETAEWRRTITALLPPPQAQQAAQEQKPPEQRPLTFWDMFWPFGRRA